MSTPPVPSVSLLCIRQRGLCTKCSCYRTWDRRSNLTQHASPSKRARWPFSTSQIVSKVAICHAGPGSAACSLKLIAAITKARPPLIYFTAYILFEGGCNLFIFHVTLLLFEHLLFCFMDWIQLTAPLILNAFIRSEPLIHTQSC